MKNVLTSQYAALRDTLKTIEKETVCVTLFSMRGKAVVAICCLLTLVVELSFDSSTAFVRESVAAKVGKLVVVAKKITPSVPLSPSSRNMPASDTSLPLGSVDGLLSFSVPSHAASPTSSFMMLALPPHLSLSESLSESIPQSPELPALLRPPIS